MKHKPSTEADPAAPPSLKAKNIDIILERLGRLQVQQIPTLARVIYTREPMLAEFLRAALNDLAAAKSNGQAPAGGPR